MILGSGKLAEIARSIVARFDSDIWFVEGSHLTTPKTENRIQISVYASGNGKCYDQRATVANGRQIAILLKLNNVWEHS
jgi:hypothetical protein